MSKFLLSCVRFRKVPVESFDGSHANLTEVPPEIYQHRKSLRKLLLNSNRINEISKDVYSLQELRELDLSENDILFMSPNISHITHLTTLNLSKNSLSVVPDTIHQCQELVFLDLSANPLQTVCAGVTRLPRLKVLLMNGCELEQLPPNIGNLSQLETLELRENFLTDLPPSIGCMSQLQKLDLGSNEFTELSPCIGSLVSLAELWLDTNILGSLPEEAGNLHKLTFLEVTGNQLLSLPQTMGGMAKLTDLYLGDNLLPTLPASMEQMSQLSVLRLDLNRLTALTDAIRGWTNLTELSMTHNYIAALPPMLGGLTKLTTFIADENLLTTLPEEIGQCSSLRVLSLRDNQIANLPTSIGQLSQLSILNIVGNRLVHMPYSMTNLKSLSAVWIAENQNRPIVEMQLEHGSEEQRTKWLTCVLFPQQGQETPFGEPVQQEPRLADSQEGERDGKHPLGKVDFDPTVQENRGGSKLNRDPTPFPKELHNKAMHWRAMREMSGEKGVEEQGADVHMRHPPRKLHRPYSLLKALQDPIGDVPPADDTTYAFDHASRSSSHSGSCDSPSPLLTTPLGHRSSLRSDGNASHQASCVMETQSTVPTHLTSVPSLSPPPLSPPNVNSDHVLQKVSEVSSVSPLPELLESPGGKMVPSDDISRVPSDGISRVPSDGISRVPSDGISRVPSDGISRVPSDGISRVPSDGISRVPSDGISRVPSDGISRVPRGVVTNGGAIVMESVMESRQEASVIITTSSHRSPNTFILSSNNNNNNNNNNSDNIAQETGQQKQHFVRSQPVATGDECDSAWLPFENPLSLHHHHHHTNPLLLDHHSTQDLHNDTESEQGSSAWYLTPDSPPSSSSSSFPLPTSHSSPAGCDNITVRNNYDHLHHLHYPQRCINNQGCINNKRHIRSASCLSWDEATPTQTCGRPRHGESLHSFDDDAEDHWPRPPEGVACRAKQDLVWHKETSAFQRLEQREDAVGHQMSCDPRRRSHDRPSTAAAVNQHGYVATPPLKRYSSWCQPSQDMPSSSCSGLKRHSDVSQASSDGHTSLTSLELIKPGQDRPAVANGDRRCSSALAGGRAKASSISLNHGHIFEVWLNKGPNVGFGVTGGMDTVGACKPGDKGHMYHTWKVAEAHCKGRIRNGDRLLQVNGTDVSSLCRAEVLRLLAGPEKILCVVLYREPSATLL